METVIARESCRAHGCANCAVIVLLERHLCLEHFFSGCYERLDLLEPMICTRSLDATETEAARVFLRECSNRALFVSLRLEPLTNLDRSRLLEILLSCGELELRLPKSPVSIPARGLPGPSNPSSDQARRQMETSPRRESPRETFRSRRGEIPRLFFFRASRDR